MNTEPMSLGVLTAGGDCPGLNAVIRAVVRKELAGYGGDVFGFYDGWRGLVDDEGEMLDINRLRGTLPRGGTILGTSRITPYMVEQGTDKVRATMANRGLDAVVVIGGEGSLACASRVFDEGHAPVIGVPKTIDNDIYGTDRTFGFDTAVAIATDAIDRLHTTAESHNRVMVVEVMGRNVGHIATWAGLAGGATLTLIPEDPFDIEAVCESLVRRHERGKYASIVVVAEGARPRPGTLEIREPELDQYGHRRLGGIGHVIAAEVEARTGFETRVTVLGHVQRGGTPTAYDRVLCSRFGVAAVEAAHRGDFGSMVALHCNEIRTVPLADIVGKLNVVQPDLWDAARTFFA